MGPPTSRTAGTHMAGSHSRSVLTLAAALGCVSCASGCADLLGIGGPDLSLQFEIADGLPQDLRLDVTVGGRMFHLASPDRRDEHAPRSGELTVSMLLLESSGRVLGGGAFNQTFRRDSNQWVAARVGGGRPIGGCVGRVWAVPLGGAVQDTLFVMHGGLSKDAVC